MFCEKVDNPCLAMQEGAVCQKLWDEKSSSAPIASLHAVQSNFLCVCHVETGKCSTCSFTGNDLAGCNNNENVINSKFRLYSLERTAHVCFFAKSYLIVFLTMEKLCNAWTKIRTLGLDI